MANTKISEYSAIAANNTEIDGINIAEGCAPSGINNAIRELMAQLKDFQAGTAGDDLTVGGNLSVTGAVNLGSVLTVTSGGTGLSSVTAGDMLYASGTNTLARLSGTAAGNVLLSGTAPSWGKVPLSTHVSGTLPVANGGTGSSTSTGSGSVVLSTSPALSGTPTAPTAAQGTNSTQIATTAFVANAVSNAGGGTVSSVGLSLPSMFTVTGSPVTSSGTLSVSYSGTALPVANGGTGSTTASGAINQLVPSQPGNQGRVLGTNGSTVSWVNAAGVSAVSAGAGMDFTQITGTGTVTMGTPSTLTKITTNAATGTTHTHAVTFPVTSIKGQSSDIAQEGDVVLSNLASFAKSLGTNGYQKFPGGLIIQWGTFARTGNVTSATFATSFSSVFSVNVTGVNPTSAAGTPDYCCLTTVSTTGFSISAPSGQTSYYYMAIGLS